MYWAIYVFDVVGIEIFIVGIDAVIFAVCFSTDFDVVGISLVVSVVPIPVFGVARLTLLLEFAWLLSLLVSRGHWCFCHQRG